MPDPDPGTLGSDRPGLAANAIGGHSTGVFRGCQGSIEGGWSGGRKKTSRFLSRRRPSVKRPQSVARVDASQWATAGVCVFLLGFAAPIPSQLPLTGLVVFALVATFVQDASGKAGVPLPLMLAVGGFLVMTGLSILFSVDRGRSLELSASWIPGVLLFVVISERLRSAENLRSVYGCFSCVALGLAIVLLAGRWLYGPDAHSWLRDLGFPVLVVPNDCHFLALLTPFSLVLAHRNPRSGLGVVALLSIGATALAIIALGGRGAMLVWVACLVVTGSLLRPRLGVGLAIASLLVVSLGDAALGFPLASKFTSIVDTRISLWIVAWEMFLDAPWMGQGPHAYRLLYAEYLNRVEFPDWVRFDPWGTAVPWPHNIYLEVLAERGALGLLTVSSLVGITLYYANQARRRGGAELALLASGAMGCMTGIFVSGIFEASFLRIWLVVLFFCLLGIVGRLAAMTNSQRNACNER